MNKIDVIQKDGRESAVAYFRHCLCKTHTDLQTAQVYCIIILQKKHVMFKVNAYLTLKMLGI